MSVTSSNVAHEQATVFIIDDDRVLREALCLYLESEGLRVEVFATASAFLDVFSPERPGCLVLDIDMPGMSGIDMQQILVEKEICIPIIFLTGKADVPATVQAFKAGAVDFLEKPVSNETLLSCIHNAIASDLEHRNQESQKIICREYFNRLSPREREVMALIAKGMSNKEVARVLEISHRTVENHRHRVMEKLEARSLHQLARIARLCQVLDEDLDV